ncbi:MAG TPA: flagellar motor protein MotA [Beijerinckiaceae bacterium]|nr:flagellar motor protein MotA [Beijerinckiaceae bacterium]
MTDTTDALRLSAPRIYLVRMIVFLILAGLIGLVLYKQIAVAFMANPALNGLIFGVLAIGAALAIRQVARLFGEVRWVNSIRRQEQRLTLNEPPVLLAPMAALLGEKAGREVISTLTFRSVLDSIGARLDESRDITRYLTGLLVFLGLLGTFWGLLETVGSIGKVVASMPTGGDATVLFDELKAGLTAPLAGMGISFSSSLFGLAGSLILGFLDLQAGQAQNRFFYELEDWLSTMTQDRAMPAAGAQTADLKPLFDRLTHVVSEASGGRASATAMVTLAEGIQTMIQHMRSEQQMIRNWVEFQADQQQEVKRLLEKLVRDEPKGHL